MADSLEFGDLYAEVIKGQFYVEHDKDETYLQLTHNEAVALMNVLRHYINHGDLPSSEDDKRPIDYPQTKTVTPWLGMPVGVNDRNGSPIHFGDVLYFDESEWGAPNEYFCVEYIGGEVLYSGGRSDLSQWCDIVRKWDGTEVGNG